MPEEDTKPAEQTAPVDQAVPQASGLSVGDLQNIQLIIDLCTRRGAFKAEELATVGSVYNKLKGFLDALPKPEGEPDKPATAPATEMPANAPLGEDK